MIGHHTTEADAAGDLAWHLERRARVIGTLPRRRSNLASLCRDTTKVVSLLLQQGRAGPEVRAGLSLVLASAVACLDASLDIGGVASFTLDGHPIELSRKGPSDLATTATWKLGFYASLLLRDNARSAWLANYPLAVLEASPHTALPHTYVMVHALQGFRLDADGWQSDLDHAVMLAEAEPENRRWIEAFELPLMRLLQVIYTDRLSEGFEAALLAHKAYYDRKHDRNALQGFVSLGPAALAGWAFDCMKPVTVESDYAPGWLIEGRF